MNDIRARFEEIWPVPEGVGWGDRTNCYFAWYPMAQEDAIAHTARLDTFTRCQETTDVYVSLVEEMVEMLDGLGLYDADVVIRAKQIMEQKK